MNRILALLLIGYLILAPAYVNGASLPTTSAGNDTFTTTGCSSAVEPLGVAYFTNNKSALPVVGKKCHRYYAELTNNARDKTLHYQKSQGRFDGRLVRFPFEVVARNVGIGTLRDSQIAPNPTGGSYVFAGLQVHVTDFKSINSSHIVVGHRGRTTYTVEGKNTIDGSSKVNDAGANVAPNGRADLRIVGNTDSTLTVYWQLPNKNPGAQPDVWRLYNRSGKFPGSNPTYGPEVYVGLITYALGYGNVPFVGTADSLNVVRSGSRSPR